MKALTTFFPAAALIALLFVPPAAGASETVLYSFCQLANCQDGAVPSASLTNIGSTLYGTTTTGGAYGGGTVFALDLNSGTETVLHSFGSGADGARPAASLLAANGMLYGTTADGGANKNRSCNGCGTVFSIDPKTGDETVLYSFCSRPGCADGAFPVAGLISVNGVLYGTTSQGGAQKISNNTISHNGTMFSLDPDTGKEAVLYSFCSQRGCPDGAFPVAGLTSVGSMLCGTTENGGGNDCGGVGCGTVFSFNMATGAETALHAFKDDENGFFPLDGLIDVNGKLYGTTVFGGDFEGTVFSVDEQSGGETVVYTFCDTCANDGHQPRAGVLNVNGTLYGTTYYGGGANASGIVFSVNMTTGKESVVYTFCSETKCADGQNPESGLININGTLYGTTPGGGTGENEVCNGLCGTVFAITP